MLFSFPKYKHSFILTRTISGSRYTSREAKENNMHSLGTRGKIRKYVRRWRALNEVESTTEDFFFHRSTFKERFDLDNVKEARSLLASEKIDWSFLLWCPRYVLVSVQDHWSKPLRKKQKSLKFTYLFCEDRFTNLVSLIDLCCTIK